MLRRCLSLFALLAVLAAVPAMAQTQVPGATLVQSSVPLYSCNVTFTATGVANTTVTATSPAGTGTFYLCTLDINEIANAAVTGAAGPAELCATTNLQNNLTWWGSNTTMVIGALVPVITLNWGGVPLKAVVSGTPFTVVCTGGQATYNIRINGTGFYQ